MDMEPARWVKAQIARFSLKTAVETMNLNSAVDLTAKNAKIAKKASYEWIAQVFHSPGR